MRGTDAKAGGFCSVAKSMLAKERVSLETDGFLGEDCFVLISPMFL